MSVAETYLLDTNVFIEAKNRYYRFATFPSVWCAFINGHTEGKVYSIDKVKLEITNGDDELESWVDFSTPESFFKSVDDVNVFSEYATLVSWVSSNPQYNQEAKNEFANIADGWIVAYAMAYGQKVVTQEKYNSFVKKKIPIPNLCKEFDVQFLDTFDMFEEMELNI